MQDNYTADIMSIIQRHKRRSEEVEVESVATTTSGSSSDGETKYCKEVFYESRSPSPVAVEMFSRREVTDLRMRINELMEDLKFKDDQINEYECRNHELSEQLGILKEEKLELCKDARSVQVYRDEAEFLKSQLQDYQLVQEENKKLKKKLDDLDFHKNLSAKLEDDNKMLQESVDLFEKQLKEANVKVKRLMGVEKQLLEAVEAWKNALNLAERRGKRIEELMSETCNLEQQIEQCNHRYHDLQQQINVKELEAAEPQRDVSLFNEIQSHNESRIFELTLENQKLKFEADKVPVLEQKLAFTKREIAKYEEQVQNLSTTLETLKEMNVEFQYRNTSSSEDDEFGKLDESLPNDPSQNVEEEEKAPIVSVSQTEVETSRSSFFPDSRKRVNYWILVIVFILFYFLFCYFTGRPLLFFIPPNEVG